MRSAQARDQGAKYETQQDRERQRDKDISREIKRRDDNGSDRQRRQTGGRFRCRIDRAPAQADAQRCVGQGRR
jgi:hypothetical protein